MEFGIRNHLLLYRKQGLLLSVLNLVVLIIFRSNFFFYPFKVYIFVMDLTDMVMGTLHVIFPDKWRYESDGE